MAPLNSSELTQKRTLEFPCLKTPQYDTQQVFEEWVGWTSCLDRGNTSCRSPQGAEINHALPLEGPRGINEPSSSPRPLTPGVWSNVPAGRHNQPYFIISPRSMPVFLVDPLEGVRRNFSGELVRKSWNESQQRAPFDAPEKISCSPGCLRKEMLC